MTKGLMEIRTHAEIVHETSQSFALTARPQELSYQIMHFIVLQESLATLLRILWVLAIPMQNLHCDKSSNLVELNNLPLSKYI